MENKVQSKINKEAIFQAIYEVYSLGMTKIDLQSALKQYSELEVSSDELEEIYDACLFKFDQEFLV